MEYVTVKKIAKMFNVTLKTAYNWVYTGAFPNAFKIGNNIRIPVGDVENLKKPTKRETA